MPARTSTRFTLAHAKASARLPKSVIRAQTATPTTQAVRKQPRRNIASARHPGSKTRKSNTHQPSTARSTNPVKPRATPTSQEPIVRWRTPIGARNWCFSDFDQTSSRTAYATSSWQTFTTDSASVPTSTKDVWSGVSWRNFDIRPIERTPTTGQKSSSKKKKTLRAPMSAFRSATAQTASSSPRKFNEHLLELRLPHLHIADHDPIRVERAEQLRKALLRLVHRALHPPVSF